MEKFKNIRARALWECELYKITRNRQSIFIFFVPALSVIFAFAYLVLFKYDAFTLNGKIPSPGNPWIEIMNILFKLYQFIFPCTVILLAAQFFRAEKLGDGYKLFQTIPVSAVNLLKIKYLNLLLIASAAVVFSYFIFLSGILFCKIFFPLFGFGEYDMRIPVALFFSRLAFAACCIIMIQYSLHLITNNYFLPIILGLIAIIIGYVPADYKEFDYYYASGYVDYMHNQFYLYGENYQWKGIWLMISAPLILTLLCFTITYFNKSCHGLTRIYRNKII